MKNLFFLAIVFFCVNPIFSQYYIDKPTQTVNGNSGSVITASIIIYRTGGPNNVAYYFSPSLCSGNSSDIYDMWIQNGGVIQNNGGYIKVEFKFRRNASSTSTSATYKFKINPDQSCLDTSSTCQVTVNYNAVCALTTPVNFTTTSISSNSVSLSWTNDLSASSYRIYYKQNNSSNYSNFVDSNCCNISIGGLLSGTMYNFRIVPKCSNGLYSSNSKTIDATTICNTLSAPTNITATPSGTSYIINYINVPGYNGYYVLDYVDLTNNSPGSLTISQGAYFYYVSPPRSFKYRIRPTGGTCYAPPSDWITVVPNLCPANNYPSGLSFTTQSVCGGTPGHFCGYGNFMWTPISGATQYQVEYQGINLTNTSQPVLTGNFLTTSSNTVQPTQYGSTSGTWIIKFRVRSKCSNGTWSDYSPWSANFAW